jgi:Rubisco LSMT substrate-binding
MPPKKDSLPPLFFLILALSSCSPSAAGEKEETDFSTHLERFSTGQKVLFPGCRVGLNSFPGTQKEGNGKQPPIFQVRGVVARTPLAPGDLILSVPETAILTPDRARLDLLPVFRIAFPTLVSREEYSEMGWTDLWERLEEKDEEGEGYGSDVVAGEPSATTRPLAPAPALSSLRCWGEWFLEDIYDPDVLALDLAMAREVFEMAQKSSSDGALNATTLSLHSKWTAIAAGFPAEFDFPSLSWNTKDLQELQASRVVQLANARRKKILQRWFSDIQPVCRNLNRAWKRREGRLAEARKNSFPHPNRWCTQGRFKWAEMGISSRSFRIRGLSGIPQHGMVPWADLFNTGTLNPDSKRGGDGSTNREGVVNVRHRMNETVLELHAAANIEEGASLLAPYGIRPLSDSQFLLDYGFILNDDSNPNSLVFIRRPRLFSGDDDSIKQKKSDLLRLGVFRRSANLAVSCPPDSHQKVQQAEDNNVNADLDELIAVMGIIAVDDPRVLSDIGAVLQGKSASADPAKQFRNIRALLPSDVEKIVLGRAEEYIQQTLDSYGSSIEEDQALLGDPTLVPRRRLAIRFRLREKRVLQACCDELRKQQGEGR